MALTITPTPLRVSKFATKPILKTLMLRSSLEKVRPLERLVLTMSPSRTSTERSLSRSSCSTISEMVVLPDPDRPVNHNVNPRSSFIYVPFDAPTLFGRSLYFPPRLAHTTIVGSLGESPSGSLSSAPSGAATSPSRSAAVYLLCVRCPSMSTSITSGRENSGGGYSPLESISRTFVPERKTCELGSCGQVFDEPMPPHSVQKNACSKKRGVIHSSPGSNSSKMCWAS